MVLDQNIILCMIVGGFLVLVAAIGKYSVWSSERSDRAVLLSLHEQRKGHGPQCPTIVTSHTTRVTIPNIMQPLPTYKSHETLPIYEGSCDEDERERDVDAEELAQRIVDWVRGAGLASGRSEDVV